MPLFCFMLLSGIVAEANLFGQVTDPFTTSTVALEYKSGSYSTDNVYIQLQSVVSNKIVNLNISSHLEAEELMKLLVLVYTLKMNNSLQINVAVNHSVNGNFNTRNFTFAIIAAGANVVTDHTTGKPIASKNPSKKKQLATSGTFVDFRHHNSLATSISENMQLPLLKNSGQVKDARIFLIAPSPEPVSESLLQTVVRIRDLKKLGAAEIHLVSPYLPYGRSDKKDIDGTAVAGRLIANLFEAAGATTISFVRAHAPQSEGWFNIPTKNISGRKTVNEFLKKFDLDMVISPDAGFQKDVTLYADDLGLPISIINKQRDTITSETKIVGISGHASLKGKTLVIFDDETSSGSTLSKAADYLKKLGAKKVVAVVTHLAGSAKSALENKNLDLLVATNSLPVMIEHPKLKILDIASEISENLKIFNYSGRNYSCSSLF